MRKDRLFTLFLICVFPIHLWSLMVVFGNIETVIYRSTNVFDGIGYAAYALILALFESMVLSLLLIALGAFLPKSLTEDDKLVHLSLICWVVLLWAAFGQIYQFLLYPWQHKLIDYFFLWLTYRHIFNYVTLIIIFIVLVASVIIPLWLVMRFPRFKSMLLKILEKIRILSYFYLVIDMLALLVIIFRNIRVLL